MSEYVGELSSLINLFMLEIALQKIKCKKYIFIYILVMSDAYIPDLPFIQIQSESFRFFMQILSVSDFLNI